jgi:hypothetical protein
VETVGFIGLGFISIFNELTVELFKTAVPISKLTVAVERLRSISSYITIRLD